MSYTEYQKWVDRVVAGRDGRPLSSGEVIKSEPAKPFGTIEFVKVVRASFATELGKKGDFYIYHFYPTNASVQETFFEHMENALLEVFKNPEQIEAVWSEEMKSWAVKVRGFTTNIWGDDLAIKVIELLDKKLGA